MRRQLITALAVLLAGSLFAACTSVTKGAIRNDSANPVTVTLISADGGEARFEGVQPNAKSDFKKLPFEKLDGVTVKVDEGQAKSGKVDLQKTKDNTVVVKDDEDPSVESEENPDNTFW